MDEYVGNMEESEEMELEEEQELDFWWTLSIIIPEINLTVTPRFWIIFIWTLRDSCSIWKN